MPKMIQVRNVPDRLHRELVRRAKKRGTTLTAYIQEILEDEVAFEPIDDVLDDIERRGPLARGIDIPVEQIIREGRDERDTSARAPAPPLGARALRRRGRECPSAHAPRWRVERARSSRGTT